MAVSSVVVGDLGNSGGGCCHLRRHLAQRVGAGHRFRGGRGRIRVRLLADRAAGPQEGGRGGCAHTPRVARGAVV